MAIKILIELFSSNKKKLVGHEAQSIPSNRGLPVKGQCTMDMRKYSFSQIIN